MRNVCSSRFNEDVHLAWSNPESLEGVAISLNPP